LFRKLAVQNRYLSS
jgi:hypothetical protein